MTTPTSRAMNSAPERALLIADLEFVTLLAPTSFGVRQPVGGSLDECLELGE